MTGIGIGIASVSIISSFAVLFYIGSVSINNEDENWVRGNEVGLKEALSIVYLGQLLSNNIASLVPSTKIMIEGKLAAARLLRMIPKDNKILENSLNGKVNGHIEFRNVKFAYYSRPNNIVLEDISFQVPPSSQLGVVGSTGSGKSTIVQLLLRFYDTLSGNIYIDHNPIDIFSIQYLRSLIGLVNQEPFLFNTSILENIRYGNLNASRDQIEDAALKSGALEFIKTLPEAFETIVGPKGSQLSGGQKQRIVIARAILRNPTVLILDEATSALDRSTEQAVLSSIDEYLPDCTRIAIAQNLLTLKNSDKIIVI